MSCYSNNRWLCAVVLRQVLTYGCTSLDAIHYWHAKVSEDEAVGEALLVGVDDLVEGLLAVDAEVNLVLEVETCF